MTIQVDHPVEQSDGPAADNSALPLGPGSMTWRLFGDQRLILLAFWAGTLQVMHPSISAALTQHSVVFENEIGRIWRSAGPIQHAVYASDDSVAHQIRDYHVDIKGDRPDGQRYHALSPEVYYWAHATFFNSQIVGAEHFGTPLTLGEKRRLYRESKTWYARYGVSDRCEPDTYDHFIKYWDDMLANTLQRTETVERSSVLNGRWHDVPSPAINPLLWKVAYFPVDRLVRFVTRGTLPPAAREILGWDWSERDEWRLRLFARVVKAVFTLSGDRIRFLPLPAEAANA